VYRDLKSTGISFLELSEMEYRHNEKCLPFNWQLCSSVPNFGPDSDTITYPAVQASATILPPVNPSVDEGNNELHFHILWHVAVDITVEKSLQFGL